jgi:hypothetical protein
VFHFGFELRPLHEVTPWGRDQATLHWFGLTDGWYGIEAGGHQLLNPPADYYVVRLWEDINVLTGTVLEPVPADLQPFIRSDPGQWACSPLDFIADDAGLDTPDHPAETAGKWHGDHYLDLGYLRAAPRLRLWRTTGDGRDEVSLRSGEIGLTVPTGDYLDAVHTLDRTLMAAMEERIEELERRGGLPGVEIDLAGLRHEHEDRSHWLARNLGRTPRTDWDAVRAGVTHLLSSAGR